MGYCTELWFVCEQEGQQHAGGRWWRRSHVSQGVDSSHHAWLCTTCLRGSSAPLQTLQPETRSLAHFQTGRDALWPINLDFKVAHTVCNTCCIQHANTVLWEQPSFRWYVKLRPWSTLVIKDPVVVVARVQAFSDAYSNGCRASPRGMLHIGSG